VADLGPVSHTLALLRELDTVILVGTGTPVGVARLIRTAGSVLAANPTQSVLSVINQTAGGAFRRSEVMAEIDRTVPGIPVITVPFDAGVEQASWDGALVTRGRYSKAVSSIGEVVVRSLT